MIPMRLADVAEVVGGRLVEGADPEGWLTGSVEFDSRSVTPGALFVALPGERVDGHDFAAAAVSAGALAVLAARPVGAPAILVADPLAALGALAAEVLRRLPQVTVVGVTGSVGKTTTKDLIAALLRELGPTVAPPGSFNTEIGHPHTVLRATAETRFLVLENGARGVGHIAALCAIARPRLAAVLNVGSAHLGEFGSREAIAVAKGELVEALPADGVAVLNGDDPLVAAMATRTAARVVTFGAATGADWRAVDIGLDDYGRAHYTLVTDDGSEMAVALAGVGAQLVPASLAAIAIAAAAGLAPARAAEVLARTAPASRWRMERTDRPDGVTVLNDAYNANPESMASALQTLAAVGAGRRRWAVLGAMAELGPTVEQAHAELGRLVADTGVDRLVTVGPTAAGTERAARGRAGWAGQSTAVPDVAAAVELVAGQLAPGDVVLVKASRSEALERIAAALLTGATTDGVL